jgi:hypothetical protein
LGFLRLENPQCAEHWRDTWQRIADAYLLSGMLLIFATAMISDALHDSRGLIGSEAITVVISEPCNSRFRLIGSEAITV